MNDETFSLLKSATEKNVWLVLLSMNVIGISAALLGLTQTTWITWLNLVGCICLGMHIEKIRNEK